MSLWRKGSITIPTLVSSMGASAFGGATAVNYSLDGQGSVTCTFAVIAVLCIVLLFISCGVQDD